MACVTFRRQKESVGGADLKLSGRVRRRIGRNIKRARIKRGLRQQDLGAFLGVNKVRISAIENGWRPVRNEELRKIEEILGVNLAKSRRMVSTEEFGQMVRDARIECGFEIELLAARLDVWPDRLGRIEAGERKPRPAERAKLQRLLRTKLPETEYCRVYPVKRIGMAPTSKCGMTEA